MRRLARRGRIDHFIVPKVNPTRALVNLLPVGGRGNRGCLRGERQDPIRREARPRGGAVDARLVDRRPIAEVQSEGHPAGRATLWSWRLACGCRTGAVECCTGPGSRSVGRHVPERNPGSGPRASWIPLRVVPGAGRTVDLVCEGSSSSASWPPSGSGGWDPEGLHFRKSCRGRVV